MTLVFRITVPDDQAHAIFRQLRPYGAARFGQRQVSNNTVRETLAPLLRARCEEQIAKWTVQVPR